MDLLAEKNIFLLLQNGLSERLNIQMSLFKGCNSSPMPYLLTDALYLRIIVKIGDFSWPHGVDIGSVGFLTYKPALRGDSSSGVWRQG